MLISPTEKGLLLKNLGKSSWIPEDYGVDVLWTAKGEMWGVQRKTPKDFVASVQDGRLNREIQQMKHLAQAAIVIDGSWEWTTGGAWTGGFMTFSRDQMLSLMASIQKEGVWVFQAKNLDEVVATIQALQRWSGKDKHVALKGRKEQMQSSWGTISNRDFQIHMLTSLPGVGVELAERILDSLGMILTCKVSSTELQSVPGIGKKKAEKILTILSGPEESSQNSKSNHTTSSFKVDHLTVR